MKHTKQVFCAVVLVLVVGALFAANYTPGTTLTGWDNLQTDLNPWLGVKRAVWSGWQEYQSFGLPAGMAHASDLVRALWVVILSWIVPQQMIRFVTHFSLIAVGAVGCYVFIRTQLTSSRKEIFAFVGALLYLFNFYTVQILSLPFEAFTFFFAFLPWELWIFSRFLNTKYSYKRSILYLIGINVLATPQSYAQQIFVVYFITLVVLGLGYIMQSKEKLFIFKRLVVALLVIILINAFWILPQAYFLKTNGHIVAQSKQNQIATEDVWLQNKSFGNVADFLTMTSYFSTLNDHSGKPIFQEWNAYRSLPIVVAMSWVVAFVILAGFVMGLRKRNLPIVVLMGISMVALLSNTILFEQLNSLVRLFPFLHQVFRSPFTKFAVVYALAASISFAYVLDHVHVLVKRTLLQKLLIVLSCGAIFILSFPSWKGKYLAPLMRVHIPHEYTELIAYFHTKPQTSRIGLLPEYTFWGWYHHTWGYDGSGFLWYGIEQPIISRTFDVWSESSENYYWELQGALVSQDSVRLYKVLSKYRVEYLIYDASIIPIVGANDLVLHDRIVALLQNTPQLILEKQFGKDISVYKIQNQTGALLSVKLTPPLISIGRDAQGSAYDAAFAQYGDYENTSEAPHTFFPFSNVNSQTRMSNAVQVQKDRNKLTLTTHVPQGVSPQDLNQIQKTGVDGDVLYSIRPEEGTITASFPTKLIGEGGPTNMHNQACTENTPEGNITIENNQIQLDSLYPKNTCIGIYFPTLSHERGYLIEVISAHSKGNNLKIVITDETLRQGVIEDRLISPTEYFILPVRSQQGVGYTLTIQDMPSKGMQNENVLSSVRVYEIPYDSLIHTQIVLKPFKEKVENPSVSRITSVTHPNYYTYNIKAIITEPSTLILNQSFDEGWIAIQMPIFNSQFSIQNIRLLPHVKINGWSNGWVLNQFDTKPENCNMQDKNCLARPKLMAKAGGNAWKLPKSTVDSQQSSVNPPSHKATEGQGNTPSDSNAGRRTLDDGLSDSEGGRTIILLFWPQYLQYAGFGIGAATILYVFWCVFKSRRHKTSP